MINIQKSYSVYFVLFGPFWSISVQSVHIGHILSISVLFGPHQSYSGRSVHFGPFSQNWSYSVDFDPIWSIMSTLILICPFVLIQSPLIIFGPNQSTLFYSVHFDTIRSTSILFGPPCSHSIIFYPFGALHFIWSNSVYLCTYIQGKNMFALLRSKYKFIKNIYKSQTCNI